MVQEKLSAEESATILVSVHLITYNQKRFIRQSLDSVLAQKTNFRFEVIIGDDFSTDGTRDIINEYVQKHPNLITPLFHPRNMGPEGMPGKNNFLLTLNACKSKYIALLDGDDYWCDEYKLQKQIDFLESHNGYAICFHRAKLVYDSGIAPFYRDINVNTPATTTLLDLIKGNYIHTPTCVFRRNFYNVPQWFYRAFTGDWVLHMLNAEFGKIYFINEEMAAYRIHGGGVLSTIKAGGPLDIGKMETFKDLANHFKGKNEQAYNWFHKIHYSQKAFYYGIENAKHLSVTARFKLLVKCGFQVKQPKLFIAALLVLFYPDNRLKKIWESASEKRKKLASITP